MVVVEEMVTGCDEICQIHGGGKVGAKGWLAGESAQV